MLDTLAPGRIVVGLLRGTTNEYLSYDLNPKESRERTDEGMELILKAWTEPQPFGWQGRHFQYRTVSIWPRPQAHRSADLCARHQRRGRRVRRAPPHRPRPFLRQFRGDGEGDRLLPRAMRPLWLAAGAGRHHLPRQHDPRRDRRCGRRRTGRRDKQAAFPVRAGVARCAAGGGHRPQRRRRAAARRMSAACCRSASAAAPTGSSSRSASAASRSAPACVDLSLHDPGTGDIGAMMQALDLFGRKVLPRIREI